MTREELVQLVKKILDPDSYSEEELEEMVYLFNKSVPNPAGSDLIFWDHRDLTAEEVVDEALNYKKGIKP
ncbi:bacteriocin immunity protein [Kroppenstedtia eburnea]|uniref:bacteriocin immunity protein n=1 Tax=Kroppenstedtia eburnea TaxID=714067 RepID=UPI00363F9026